MTIDRGQTNYPSVFEADLPTLAYEQAASPGEAHCLIRQAHRQGPIAMGSHGPEVLSYDLVRTVLRDDRFATPKGVVLKEQGITSGELWDISARWLPSLGKAEHTRQRRLVSKAFTPRAAGRFSTTCVDIITGLIDRGVGGGHCDVVTDVAKQYPIPVICALLGTPSEDWPLFSDWADDFFKIFDWNVVNDAPDILRAWHGLRGYLNEMVDRRRDALTDDLVSDMLRAEVEGDSFTQDEVVNLAAQMLVAGTDTTRNQLAAAVEVFCHHPDQWAMLAERPELAPRAVEETMRYSPIIFATMREAVVDADLGGVTIPAGTFVMANTAAANRDPAVCEDPDRFDITREDPPGIQTFGGGMHHCLGAHLARIELAEALATVARRMPNIRLTGPVPWKPITGISGPLSVPVAFDCVD